ncbi:MAG: hypothetical protein EXR71_01710 [Myxococcales bacterium]|nr:hypothetical protein [Myxococcales bacterium]
MRVACPDCTNPLEAGPGEEVVCPACFTRFEAPGADQVPRRFDVFLPDGAVLPRQSFYAVREAIYTGKIPITSHLRPDVGSDDLIPVYALPWFAQIFALLAIEPPAHSGTRRIAGWQGIRKGGPTARPPSAPSAERRVRGMVSAASVPALLAIGVIAFLLVLVGVAVVIAI